MNRTAFTFISIALLAGSGCVSKQKITVSTNPIGATIYADGEKACTSPCTVSFDKQNDHLITIVKDGYEQEDLTIERRFKPDTAIREGIISGVLRGVDPKEVGTEVAKEVDEQERSGEAYELIPGIVTVTLTPKE